MKYPHLIELKELEEKGLIRTVKHPYFPLTLYTYTIEAKNISILHWTECLNDCRGLILENETGEIIGRPFSKFWNIERVMDKIPNSSFRVWEKLDGSLGLVCYYAGENIFATKGSFSSDQANWLKNHFTKKYPDFSPSGETYLFEIIYPENRIVVNYGKEEGVYLLAVMSPDGYDLWNLFESNTRFPKAKNFDGLDIFNIESNGIFNNQEGFVVTWNIPGERTFRAKVKFQEYLRLHHIITESSTTSIWECLMKGDPLESYLDRVPLEFKEWVEDKIELYRKQFTEYSERVKDYFYCNQFHYSTKKEFVSWALNQKEEDYTLLFNLWDCDLKEFDKKVWEKVKPKWEKPWFKSNSIEVP